MARTDLPRIYLSPPHMGTRELEYIKDAFDTNWIAPLGAHVDAFERDCAAIAGVSSALAVTNGTAAAALIARLLDIGPDSVIVASSLTFIASVAPFAQTGASLVLVDSEPESWNMSPKALDDALTDLESKGRRAAAVVLVDLYGMPADMDALIAICDRHGVPAVEDAAEALGSTYKGRGTGGFGKFAYYSFNGNKIITTSCGGMLLSDDADAIARARFLSTQARENAPWYQHETTGYNYRMSNILAAIGRGQLELLPDRVSRRREIFKTYEDAIGGIDGIEFMPEPKGSVSNRWLTTLTIDSQKTSVSAMDIINALADENIEARPVWKPMHMQPVFKDVPYFEHDGDVSRSLFENGVCLPSGSSLSSDDLERVISTVRRTLSK